jgi:peptidoglycan/xylan/chitin deacetylase (PgdA/CDA1 family)
MNRGISQVVCLWVSACYFLVRALWKMLGKMTGLPAAGEGVVLCYHAIPPQHAADFSAQMEMLRRYCIPVAPNHTGTVPANKRFAAVTFDDGHKSVLENAIPVLIRYQIPCAIFFITELFGQPAPWAGLKGYDPEDTYLREDDIAHLPNWLVIVGSHTATHPRLPRMAASHRLRELADSRTRLQQLTGQPIELFAFPYGAQNSDCVRDAAKAGYERVFTVEPKSAFRRPNEYVTGRVVADPHDWKIEFLLKLHGAYNWRSQLFAVRDCIRMSRGCNERITVEEVESIHLETIRLNPAPPA